MYVQNLAMQFGMKSTVFIVTICFSKTLAECEPLAKLTVYVRCAYQHVLYIPLHIPIYYLFIVVCFTIKYKTFTRNCYQMNTKLKHKELFKLRAHRKGQHSNIRVNTFKIVTLDVEMFLFLSKNLGNRLRFIL